MAVFTNFAATLARQPAAASLTPRLNKLHLNVFSQITGVLMAESAHNANIDHNNCEGTTIITFIDKGILQANIKAGILHGKAYVYDSHKKLKAIGYFKDGSPHGPFWIINENQFALINFENGKTSIVFVFQNILLCFVK